VSVSSEQVNQWLVLLTLNLMVMSSILMELMVNELNMTDYSESAEVKKWLGQTLKQQSESMSKA